MPPAPCTTGSTIDAGQLVRVAGDQLADVLGPALRQARLEAVGRPLGEDVLRQHAREQRVHPADRVAHRHRPERVAVVAAAHRQAAACARDGRAARWYCSAILIATSTDDRAGVGEEHALSPSGVDRRPAARRAAPPARASSPPNITCAISLQLPADRRVERRVAVAVDRAPPRGHPVDQLAAVGQRQAHALGARRPAAAPERRQRAVWDARRARGRARAAPPSRSARPQSS